MSVPYHLYRHYNSAGELLYVGISLSSLTRLARHKSRSGWFQEIACVDLEVFDTKEEALEAEKKAIRNERPKFNIRHSPPPPPNSLSPPMPYAQPRRERRGTSLSDPKWAKHAIFMPKEAGEILGRSPWTIWDAVKRGQIPTVVVGRRKYIARGTLANIINGQTAS
jgi:predicted GIY-YIG superfamily endonuclease